MKHESLAHAAGWVVRTVTSLTEQRSTAERTIESTASLRLERADDAKRRAMRAAEDAFQSGMAAVQAAYEETTLSARADRERVVGELERARSIELSKLESKREMVRDSLAEREREARWLSETVYDAELAGAKSDRDAKKERIQRCAERIVEVKQELVEWREDYPVISRGEAEAALERVEMHREGRSADDLLAAVDETLEGLRSERFPRLASLSSLAVSCVLLAVVGAGVVVGVSGEAGGMAFGVGGGCAVLGVAIWIWIRGVAGKQARQAFEAIGVMMRSAVAVLEADGDESQRVFDDRRVDARRKRKAELAQHMTGVDADRDQFERESVERSQEIEQTYTPQISAAHARFEQETAASRAALESAKGRVEVARDAAVAEAEEAYAAAIKGAEEERGVSGAELRSMWVDGMAGVQEALDEFGVISESWRAWDASTWDMWQPAVVREPGQALVARVGSVRVDRADLAGGVERGGELRVAVPASFEVPIAADVQRRGSILIEHNGEPEAIRSAVAAAQSAMLRLLTEIPAGKLRFTLVDPVALGQNFAGFMHLADSSELLVTHRIWTDPRHIEERLTDLTEHMENVIQKYLRNEFETIDAYNERAGEIAEPYRYLVVADFPVNMEEASARRLSSIVSSGARCGVHTIIVRDVREPMPKGIQEEDLRRGAVTLRWDRKLRDGEGGFRVWLDEAGDAFGDRAVEMDAPPSDAVLTSLVQRVGEAAVDASRVEVPFGVVSPGESEFWSRSAASDVCVPLGRSGATKLQELSLGRGTAQHALIAGKTGSGKSTLLHVLVTNLALWYRPDEVEFYLVDFKKGVEFKAYASTRIPHARAVAIESDREFGLSVLQRVDAELKRRGDLFRDAGVQNVQGFREAQPGVAMPRVLLIIDEFQELFVEDDKLSQDSALLLDRLVRQGRAFGIHLVLGSQTLGGAYGLARSTLNQMAVRIALQCSEADSYLILSEENAAARLLTRPGEAIYNDDAGRIEGNSPFQVVWLPDSERDAGLRAVSKRVAETGVGEGLQTIVFEGNAPARIEDNLLLDRAWSAESESVGESLRGWIGEAISIKEPTSVEFRRQSGAHALLVGQQPDLARGVLGSLVLGFCASIGRSGGVVYLADGTPADDSASEAFAGLAQELALGSFSADVRSLAYRDVEGTIVQLAEEVERRMRDGDSDEPSVVLGVFGVQRFRGIRKSDDFGFSMDDDVGQAMKPDKAFATILREGPAVGVHLVVWADTVATVERTFERQAVREFEQRVLFQMSATDSTSLIDSPAASRLGPNRGLLFVEETGVAEKFRPYAFSADLSWLARTPS